jgi:hypothetical protein
VLLPGRLPVPRSQVLLLLEQDADQIVAGGMVQLTHAARYCASACLAILSTQLSVLCQSRGAAVLDEDQHHAELCNSPGPPLNNDMARLRIDTKKVFCTMN